MMATLPSGDPLHPSMSGDQVDPALVLAAVRQVYLELTTRYNQAKFGHDPVGRRAVGECRHAVGAVMATWEHAANHTP